MIMFCLLLGVIFASILFYFTVKRFGVSDEEFKRVFMEEENFLKES